MKASSPAGGWRRRWAALACAILAGTTALVSGGCGGARGSPAATVGVTERDFHVGLSTSTVTAGDVVLRVHNSGPDEHELIIVPDASGGPPLRPDGFTVDEAAVQTSEPGSLGPGQPGSTRDLHVRLGPGRYLLFCNMAGHFMGGMHTMLVVKS